MLRSVAIALLLGAAGAIAPSACTSGPGRDDVAIGRLRTAVLDKAAQCECEELEWLLDGWTLSEPDPTEAFDAECLDRWTEWVQALSCEAPAVPGFAELCPLYHGTTYLGMPCEDRIRSLDDLMHTSCARGLYCIAGQCRDPLREDLREADQPCDFGERCAEGTYCSEELCKRLPTVGDPCLEGRCAAGLSCDQDRCIALPGPDEPCLFGECNESAYCVFDTLGSSRCFRKAAEGEPCMGHSECLSGNCPAGRCARPARAGEPCSNRLPCGEGLRCDGDTCQPTGDELGLASSCELISEL